MVKTGEEILDNGQILEIFEEKECIIKKPKAIENIETTKVITLNKFNNMLGRETIKKLLILAKTDIEIETFKWFLASCTNGIDLKDQNLLDGLGYLLQQGYITQEKYNSIIN